MSPFRRFVLPVALVLASQGITASSLAAQAKLGPADARVLPPTDTGRVKIGAAAPDFTLARKGGAPLTLSSFRGQKAVVLVFYRGSWCPYCMKQLGELRTLLDAPLKQQAELLVISPDGDDGIQKAIDRISADGVQPDFTFLSDPTHVVIDRYGVLNPSGASRGLPHPTTLVIDRDGIVRWKDVQVDYKIRPTNSAILGALKALPAR